MWATKAVIAGAVALSVGGCAEDANYFQPTVPVAESAGISRCDVVGRGVEFRATLPDKRRYLYMSVTAVPNIPPTILVVVDKSYDATGQTHPEAKGTKARFETDEQKLAAWSADRVHPMLFSSDAVSFSWDKGGHLAGTIPDLTKRGSGYAGAGSRNANVYAFQLQYDLTGFDGDHFDVTLPDISYDGTRLNPPVVRFTRTDATLLAPAKC